MKLSSYPLLVKEWHPTKNGELIPNDFALKSNKKAWWLCPKGHSYETVIASRTDKKTGCPFCVGKKASKDNNLLVLFPEVCKEWHPTKNKDLFPNQFTIGSKKKVWWLCPKGHSYERAIYDRTGKHQYGCSYCSGRKPTEDNNLLVLFPEVAKEWHPTKNGDLLPNQVTYGSEKKVWWLCSKGHSYEGTVHKRTRKKRIYDTGTRLKKEGPTGCPYCTGQKVGEDNNLLAVFPEIAKEWHPTKNGSLTPKDVSYGSSRTGKVWWLCPKGHSYNAAINSRTSRKSGCPKCSNQSSEPEIRILSELKWLFEDVKSRYKFDGVEIDIFLPSINVGIEYDGKYWHKDIEATDLKKNQFLLSNNINLIRVRQRPLKPLTEDDLIVNKTLEKTDLDEIVKKIAPFVEGDINEKIKSYLVQSSFVNDELFKKYRSYFPSPFPEHSLLKTHPFPSSEWHYEKNYPLRPENFTFGSDTKTWWLCPKGHSYKAAIKNRTNKDNLTGCPYCSGNKSLNLDLFK